MPDARTRRPDPSTHHDEKPRRLLSLYFGLSYIDLLPVLPPFSSITMCSPLQTTKASLLLIFLHLPILLPITVVDSLSMSAAPTSPRSAATTRLRSILAEHPTPAALQEPAIVVPGVHDALSAKIFASHDSTQVLFLSGFGVSATLLESPMSES